MSSMSSTSDSMPSDAFVTALDTAMKLSLLCPPAPSSGRRNSKKSWNISCDWKSSDPTGPSGRSVNVAKDELPEPLDKEDPRCYGASQAYQLLEIANDMPVLDYQTRKPTTKEELCRDYERLMMSRRPHVFDCLRLLRSTREWERLVRNYVESLKQLSDREALWLYNLLIYPSWGMCLAHPFGELLPKSFFAHARFRSLARQCLGTVTEERMYSKAGTQIIYFKSREEYTLHGLFNLSTLTIVEASLMMQEKTD